MHTLSLLVIVTASIVLMLLRPRGIAEVWWVAGGALILVVTGLVPVRLAARAVQQGSDVYLFLIGMMLLSELARVEGVFDWLAAIAVERAHGSSARLFALVFGLGILVTAFMSNDATAVVLTPAILAAVRRAKTEPLPHLIACAFVANAASFVLPISNPANLVVYRGAMPSLGDWLIAFGFASVLSIAVTYALLRVLYRDELRGEVTRSTEKASRLPLPGKATMLGLAAVSATLLLASWRGVDLGLPTCGAAIIITLLIRVPRRAHILPIVRGVNWPTIALVAALFIMVAAVESIGALSWTSSLLARAGTVSPGAGALSASAAVAFGNNIVNNLPLGLLVGATLEQTHVTLLLQRALLIGVDLGPNLSVTGSLATILWLIALRKERIEVGFFQFLRIGAITMPLALLAATTGAFVTCALSH